MTNKDNALMTGTLTTINKEVYLKALKKAIEWYTERSRMLSKELSSIKPGILDILLFNLFLNKQVAMYKNDIINYDKIVYDCQTAILYLDCLDKSEVSIDLNTFSFLYVFINGKGA